MVILLCAANGTADKILHGLDLVQVGLRGDALDITTIERLKTKALIMMVRVFLSKACFTWLISPKCAMQLNTVKATREELLIPLLIQQV